MMLFMGEKSREGERSKWLRKTAQLGMEATGMCAMAWHLGNSSVFVMLKSYSHHLLLNGIFLPQFLILIWFKQDGPMTNLAIFRQHFIKGSLVH